MEQRSREEFYKSTDSSEAVAPTTGAVTPLPLRRPPHPTPTSPPHNPAPPRPEQPRYNSTGSKQNKRSTDHWVCRAGRQEVQIPQRQAVDDRKLLNDVSANGFGRVRRRGGVRSVRGIDGRWHRERAAPLEPAARTLHQAQWHGRGVACGGNRLRGGVEDVECRLL